MLAYVFWHRRRDGVDAARYEEALRRFHDALDVRSASFRLAKLPFAALDGYEDWYLVEGWQALGDLNTASVDERRRGPHDSVSALAGEGWGGVYALERGSADPPAGARWAAKPPGQSYEEFLGALPDAAVWQRQLVLGPAAEFCIAQDGHDGRERLI